MTDGILVREMMADPLLTKYFCVILDEAHERSLNTDLLLAMLRKMLDTGKRPNFKLIVCR